jgi:membrane protein implicated in regulation of membrane protease activity
MKKVDLILMWFCVIAAVFLVAVFVFSWVVLRQLDFSIFLFVAGAIVTARVFWERCNTMVSSEDKTGNQETKPKGPKLPNPSQ